MGRKPANLILGDVYGKEGYVCDTHCIRITGLLGITDGSNAMGDITREQLATMLWRNAGSPITGGDLSRFSDADSVSAYALNAVRWASSNGILSGLNGRSPRVPRHAPRWLQW